jgi:undecaprenyl-diphosphatase
VKWLTRLSQVKWSTIRHWFHLSAAFFSLGLFILISREIFGEDSAQWANVDRNLLMTVGELRTSWLNSAALDITALASVSVLSLLLLLLLMMFWFKRNRIGVLHVSIAFFGTLFLQAWTKDIFERPRPEVIPKLANVASSSYPSGHAFAAAAVYLTLAIMASQQFKTLYQRATLYSFAGVLISLIAFSRVYLGVHYPSDVVSGVAVGAAWAYFLAAIVNWWTGRRSARS